MPPKYQTPEYPPPADVSRSNLVAQADAPHARKDSWRSFPLIGSYLSIMTKSSAYYATLENCVDLMAADLEGG
jgi:hypothetical protein